MHLSSTAFSPPPGPVAPPMKLYLQAMRVKSLWISTVCVLSGGAVGLWEGHFALAGLVLAWLGAVAVQAATNLTNVFHNYKSSTATPSENTFDPEGSAAPVRMGKLAPANVRAAATWSFAVGIVAGLALTALYGWRILVMGIPGLAVGYFYAAPPVRLSYLGLGVPAVFLFMGPVMVIGTYWVQSGAVSASAVLVALCIGLMAAGIMHINDVRDYATDVLHRKHTLAILLGRDRASWLLIAMNTLAYGMIVTSVLFSLLPWPVLGTLVTLPLAFRQSRVVMHERDPAALNGAWFLSVQLHTQFGAMVIAGLVIARALRI